MGIKRRQEKADIESKSPDITLATEQKSRKPETIERNQRNLNQKGAKFHHSQKSLKNKW